MITRADVERLQAAGDWKRLMALLERAVAERAPHNAPAAAAVDTPAHPPAPDIAPGGKLRRIYMGDQPAGWLHWCPGCKSPHGIYVEQAHPRTNAKWTFDGNMELPTFGPSIRCYHTAGEWGGPEGKDWVEKGPQITDCHYFIKAGMIEYCGDCRHALNGQTVPLPPYENHG